MRQNTPFLSISVVKCWFNKKTHSYVHRASIHCLFIAIQSARNMQKNISEKKEKENNKPKWIGVIKWLNALIYANILSHSSSNDDETDLCLFFVRIIPRRKLLSIFSCFLMKFSLLFISGCVCSVAKTKGCLLRERKYIREAIFYENCSTMQTWWWR